MKLLITGANGQVGTELKQLAQTSDFTILATGKEQLDISDKEQVSMFFSENEPDIVINASAYTAVDQAEDDQALANKINHTGAEILANACSEHNIPLLHISTDYVFDGSSKTSYKENDTVNPLGVYGASKESGEQAIQKATEKYIILRVAWVFGIHGNNFVKTMLRLAKTNDSINVVNDQFGGPTPAKDIAEVLMTLATKYKTGNTLDWGIFHYCGAPKVSWYEFAQAIFKQAQNKNIINDISVKPIPTSEFPTRVTRPANSMLDCSKIKNTYKIEQANWNSALDDMLNQL